MSQALRKITAITGKTGTTIIFLNQLRMKIGIMFGNPETTTGGNALKFYASIRMDIRQKDKILKDGKVIPAPSWNSNPVSRQKRHVVNIWHHCDGLRAFTVHDVTMM